MTVSSIAVPFSTSTSFTYAIDCHPNDANETFVAINFVKAIFVFVANLFVNEWLGKMGLQILFTIGFVNVLICLCIWKEV